LLTETALGLAVHAAAAAGVVQGVEKVADPPEVLDDRPALRLGGMRGQDLGHLDRSGQRREGSLAAVAELPDALALLGDVDQLEERGERAGDVRALVAGDPLDHAVDRRGARRRRALVQPPYRAPQRFDRREELVAAVLADRVAEQRRQEPDVATERLGHGPLPAARRVGRA